MCIKVSLILVEVISGPKGVTGAEKLKYIKACLVPGLPVNSES